MTTKPKEVDLHDDDVSILKIDQAPREYTFLNKYGPLIEETLPKKQRELIMHIGKYRNANIDRLETIYVTNYPYWKKVDSDIIYEVCGATEKESAADLMAINRPESFKILKFYIKPYHLLLLLLIRYYTLQNKMKEAHILYYYMAYSLYWGVFNRFFPKFNPDPKVVMHVINEMPQRFKLKQMGSVNKWLFYAAEMIMNTYHERLIRASDNELIYIVDGLWTKIRNLMSTIVERIYQASKDKEIVLKGLEMTDEGEQREQTGSLIGEVVSTTDMLTAKFFSNPISETIVRRVVNGRTIGPGEIRSTVLAISDNPKNYNDVNEFFQSIIYLYLSDDKNTIQQIGSLHFLDSMLVLYKKTNATDPNIITIRTVSDKWLRIGSATYRTTNRGATANELRKAIFLYFAWFIAQNKK